MGDDLQDVADRLRAIGAAMDAKRKTLSPIGAELYRQALRLDALASRPGRMMAREPTSAMIEAGVAALRLYNPAEDAFHHAAADTIRAALAARWEPEQALLAIPAEGPTEFGKTKICDLPEVRELREGYPTELWREDSTTPPSVRPSPKQKPPPPVKEAGGDVLTKSRFPIHVRGTC